MALLDRFERFLDQVLPAPDEAAASVRRAEALLSAGDADGALRLADEALAVAPAYLRALTLRVDALAALDRAPEALAALEAAHRERALPPPLLARMVALAAHVGDEARALDLDVLLRARLRGRDAAVALRLLDAARSLVAQGREAAGLRLARGATLADPALGGAWLLLGHDAHARGDLPLARRALERALTTLDPADARGNREAGELAWRLGDRATASRCLRRAWIAGDEGAIATLVAVLAQGDDAAALERVLASARGAVGDVARGLVALSRGAPAAALDLVAGGDIPAVLWHWALDVALRDAPSLAARWCDEAPDRPAAREALAVVRARDALLDDPLAALAGALAHPATRTFAREALRGQLRRAWSGRLDALLEALARMLEDVDDGAALGASLRQRRRELDEPLRVVLLGEFSAGKSTFLNALVGAEVSPMGVLPTTAHVHWLRHGERGARVLDRAGGVVESTVEEAARAVARRRAAGVEIDHVEVTLPLPRLARLELVDTPGFNSGDPAHEAAVRRAFDLADVGLWLFDARQAGRHSERGPLEEAAARALPVVGVLNKVDQVPDGSRAEVLALVREGFEALGPCVLAVSARGALAATRAGDAEALRASGWEALTAWLDVELVARRAGWKHARAAARAREVVERAGRSLDAREEASRRRAVAVAALSDAVTALREALLRAGPTLRREVAAALGDQLRGLRDERVTDRDALVADAVAEVGWRARARALAELSERLREVERLAAEVGLVASGAREVATAPVVQWLDHVVAQGARDAVAGAEGVDASAFLASDPMATLEAANERAALTVDAPADALRVALEVAREELSSFGPPEVRVPPLEEALAGA